MRNEAVVENVVCGIADISVQQFGLGELDSGVALAVRSNEYLIEPSMSTVSAPLASVSAMLFIAAATRCVRAITYMHSLKIAHGRSFVPRGSARLRYRQGTPTPFVIVPW